MRIIRWLYAAALIASAVFVIMYMDVISLLMFLVLLLLPALLFLSVLLAWSLTSATVTVEKTVATAGEPLLITLRLRNRSFLALPGARVELRYRGGFADTEEQNEPSFPLSAGGQQTVVLELNSRHVGKGTLYVGDVILQDYFRLFSLRLKLRRSYEICFLPDFFPVDLTLRPHILAGDDSDIFSKTKKGDDPSEVFAIRDYVGGDKLNRIHWKLSSKQDTLLVKDYSLPINNRVLLLLELSAPESAARPDLLDAAVSTVASLSAVLCEAEVLHYVCWYDAAGERFYNEEIKTREDLFAVLGMLLNSRPGVQSDALAFWRNERRSCSHLAYISPLSDDAAAEQLGELSYTSPATLFQICADERTPLAAVPAHVQLIPVPCRQAASALAEVAL